MASLADLPLSLRPGKSIYQRCCHHTPWKTRCGAAHEPQRGILTGNWSFIIPPAYILKQWIIAQSFMIIKIFIALTDSEDSLFQKSSQTMCDFFLISFIGEKI